MRRCFVLFIFFQSRRSRKPGTLTCFCQASTFLPEPDSLFFWKFLNVNENVGDRNSGLCRTWHVVWHLDAFRGSAFAEAEGQVHVGHVTAWGLCSVHVCPWRARDVCARGPRAAPPRSVREKARE